MVEKQQAISLLETSDSELFNNEQDSEFNSEIEIENTSASTLDQLLNSEHSTLVDKEVKQLRKFRQKLELAGVSTVLDLENKTMVLINRGAISKLAKTDEISLLNLKINQLQKNIEALLVSFGNTGVLEQERRRLSIYRKELVRYNKKKFKYWFVVNNEWMSGEKSRYLDTVVRESYPIDYFLSKRCISGLQKYTPNLEIVMAEPGVRMERGFLNTPSRILPHTTKEENNPYSSSLSFSKLFDILKEKSDLNILDSFVSKINNVFAEVLKAELSTSEFLQEEKNKILENRPTVRIDKRIHDISNTL